MKKLVFPAMATLFAALLFTGCASMSGGSGPSASAMLMSTSGSTATGTVTFVQRADGSVDVSAHLTGVPPGVHGFHVHDKGDCGDNGNAAGGHFNPESTPHAAPNVDPHHAGDFGNVTADAAGVVDAKFNTHSITVTAGANSVVGHAVILHANPDDLTTQPSGNAGPRIACGIAQMK
jgi:superoxide dismutase, Cu-Zn family